MNDEPITPVLFRVDKHGSHKGDVTAIFPTLREDRGHVTCYAHVGQHCTASLDWARRFTRPATPAEYADLKSELERIGYRLKVYQRSPRRN